MEQELTPALPVHVVDEAAGQGLEEQAEDSHAGTKALGVREAGLPVEDADVDDVQEDGGRQATEKLQDRSGAGPGVTMCPQGFRAPRRCVMCSGLPDRIRPAGSSVCALLSPCALLENRSAGRQDPVGEPDHGLQHPAQGCGDPGLDPACGHDGAQDLVPEPPKWKVPWSSPNPSAPQGTPFSVTLTGPCWSARHPSGCSGCWEAPPWQSSAGLCPL